MDIKKNLAYFHRKKDAEDFQKMLKKKIGVDSEISKQTIDNRVYYMVSYVYNKAEV